MKSSKEKKGLSIAEQWIKENPCGAQKVRDALIDKERARGYVKYLDDAGVLDLDQLVCRDSLSAVRVQPHGTRKYM
mgnify:CR=1 FL=1